MNDSFGLVTRLWAIMLNFQVIFERFVWFFWVGESNWTDPDWLLIRERFFQVWESFVNDSCDLKTRKTTTCFWLSSWFWMISVNFSAVFEWFVWTFKLFVNDSFGLMSRSWTIYLNCQVVCKRFIWIFEPFMNDLFGFMNLS